MFCSVCRGRGPPGTSDGPRSERGLFNRCGFCRRGSCVRYGERKSIVRHRRSGTEGWEALAEAVAEAGAEELKRAAEEAGQLDLFEAPRTVQGTQVTVVNGHRGPGRPPGARNKRTDEASRIYMSRFGDPLDLCIEIAELPIVGSNGRVLTELTKIIGAPSGFEAFKAWQTAVRDALPYSHTRLATLTVKACREPGWRTRAAAVELCRGRGPRTAGAHPQRTGSSTSSGRRRLRRVCKWRL